MGKQKAALILLLMLCFVAVCFPDFRAAEANFTSFPLPEPAYLIKSDGSVDPPTAPIRRDGDVYTLTGNIVGYTIRVERDSVTLDGGGYGLIGDVKLDGYALRGYNDPVGIFIMNRHDVTVRNMKISGFAYGIHLLSYLGSSSNNRLENNVVTDSYYGVYMAYSAATVLRNNRMENNARNLCVHDNVQVSPEVPNIYVNDIDSSNTVDGKPVIYWVNKQGETVPSDAGFVALINCENIVVQNLNIANNGQGILLSGTNNSQISKNHVSHADTGIFIYKSSNLAITENNLENTDVCISARRISDNNISANTMTRSKSGISLVAGPSQNNIICGNSVTNSESGMYIGGLVNTTIQQNTITEINGTGIGLLGAQKTLITANTITSNSYDGIQLWTDATENTISKNLIANNKIGIRIQDTSNNRIIENTFTNNNYGIQLRGNQNNNTIYHNNFNKQTGEPQVEIRIEKSWSGTEKPEGANVWDNGATGNYWNDYNGTDADGDGVGDTPYALSAKNIDRYPLMAPFEVDTSSNPLQTPDAVSEMPPTTTLLIASTALIVATSLVLVVYLRKHKRGTAPASLQA